MGGAEDALEVLLLRGEPAEGGHHHLPVDPLVSVWGVE